MITCLNRHADKKGSKIIIRGGDDKSNCVTVSSLSKLNLDSCYIEVPEKFYLKGVTVENASTRQMRNLKGPNSKANAFLATSWKGSSANGMTLVEGPKRMLRRITPTEASRLQTVPDWYKWECSGTQQYRMLGNGWTVAVIYHIFSFIK